MRWHVAILPVFCLSRRKRTLANYVHRRLRRVQNHSREYNAHSTKLLLLWVLNQKCPGRKFFISLPIGSLTCISCENMLDRAGGGGATEVGEESSGDFGSFAPARERKPALVGAGADKRGDLDDDIPF